jgi:Kdo2-lipid IVA lauroyltransferase/acyltransferase
MHSHNTPVFKLQWLAPSYWPLWFLLALWYVLVLLPYPLLVLMGKGVGRLLLVFGTSRRLIAQRNLELCFPELSVQERKKILVESFETGGIALFEMGMAWWWPDWRLKNLCHLNGLEHIKNLNGQGALLLGMHFTTIDLCGACFSMRQPYGGMYRSHDNPLFDYVQWRGRSRKRFVGEEGLVLFPREDLRTMIRLLKRGKPVWYAPDQDYGVQRGVFAPFFGVPAATITATAKLAEMGKARVLPLTHKRLANFKGYEVTVHPPLENYPVGNELEDATRINQVLEKYIRQNPGQYLWAHRRFKSRPEGVADRYPEIHAARLARRKKRVARRQKQSREKENSSHQDK